MAKRPPNAGKSENPPDVRSASKLLTRTRGPGKITPEVLDAICARLERSSPMRVACHLEGVTPEALRELMGKYPEIAFEVERARSLGIERLRGQLEAGAASGLKTYAGFGWLLERQYPNEFRPPPTKQELTGKDGGPVETSGGLQITITDAKRIIRERRAKGDK